MTPLQGTHLISLLLNSKWTLHALLTLFVTRFGVPCSSAAVRIPMHICKAPLVPACTSFLPSPRCVCKHILMPPPHLWGCQELSCIPLTPVSACGHPLRTRMRGRMHADWTCKPRGSVCAALGWCDLSRWLSTWGAAVGAVAPEAALSAITGIVFILHLFGVVRVVVVLLLHDLLLLFLLRVLVILGVCLLFLVGHHALLLLFALMIIVHHFADAPPGRGSPALAVAAASSASSPCSSSPGPAPTLTAAASPTRGAAAAAASFPLAAPPGGDGGRGRGLGSPGPLLLGPRRRLRLGRARPPAAAAAPLPGPQPPDGARRGGRSRGARLSGARRRLLLLGRPASPAPHLWALAGRGKGGERKAREGARSPDRRLRGSSPPCEGSGPGRGAAEPWGPRAQSELPASRSGSPPAAILFLRLCLGSLRSDWGKRRRQQAPSASRDPLHPPAAARGRGSRRPREPCWSRRSGRLRARTRGIPAARAAPPPLPQRPLCRRPLTPGRSPPTHNLSRRLSRGAVPARHLPRSYPQPRCRALPGLSAALPNPLLKLPRGRCPHWRRMRAHLRLTVSLRLDKDARYRSSIPGLASRPQGSPLAPRPTASARLRVPPGTAVSAGRQRAAPAAAAWGDSVAPAIVPQGGLPSRRAPPEAGSPQGGLPRLHRAGSLPQPKHPCPILRSRALNLSPSRRNEYVFTPHHYLAGITVKQNKTEKTSLGPALWILVSVVSLNCCVRSLGSTKWSWASFSLYSLIFTFARASRILKIHREQMSCWASNITISVESISFLTKSRIKQKGSPRPVSISQYLQPAFFSLTLQLGQFLKSYACRRL